MARHFGESIGNGGGITYAKPRKFPSPWPRRLCVLVALAAAGVALGVASGVVL